VKSKSKLWKRIRARWQIYVLLLLPVVYLIVFSYVPMGGLVLAFKSYNVRKGIWGSPWVGLQNFKKFFSSYNFATIMKNTITISLYSLVSSSLTNTGSI